MSGPKRGLGRGLDALIEKREEEGGTARMVPVGSLRPNRLQPRSRFDEDELEGLAGSIRAQGLVQPLVVSPEEDGSYSIIAGERRWRAAQRAGLATVPVIIRRQVDDRERLELALVENLQRTDLNPIEEAEAYLLLQERFSLSQEEVAARLGKSRSAVTNALRLLRLPPPVLEMLRTGQLTAGQARPLLAPTLRKVPGTLSGSSASFRSCPLMDCEYPAKCFTVAVTLSDLSAPGVWSP